MTSKKINESLMKEISANKEEQEMHTLFTSSQLEIFLDYFPLISKNTNLVEDEMETISSFFLIHIDLFKTGYMYIINLE